MRPLASTAAAPIEFNAGLASHKIRAVGHKIGWITSLADKPGARFDIVIKDGIGRVKMEKKNCGNETEKYGELLNLETMMGEDLHVEVENLRGAEKLQIFLN